jgi:hypothetical protein
VNSVLFLGHNRSDELILNPNAVCDPHLLLIFTLLGLCPFMVFSSSLVRVFAIVLICFGLGTEVQAQSAVPVGTRINLPPGVQLPPNVQIPPGVTVNQSGQPTGAMNQPSVGSVSIELSAQLQG